VSPKSGNTIFSSKVVAKCKKDKLNYFKLQFFEKKGKPFKLAEIGFQKTLTNAACDANNSFHRQDTKASQYCI
jgi:hypothetical protein